MFLVLSTCNIIKTFTDLLADNLSTKYGNKKKNIDKRLYSVKVLFS